MLILMTDGAQTRTIPSYKLIDSDEVKSEFWGASSTASCSAWDQSRPT